MSSAVSIRFSSDLSIQKFEKGDYLIHEKAHDKRVVVNDTVLKIVERLKDSEYDNFESIVKIINEELGIKASLEEVKKLIYEKLAPSGIIEMEGVEVSKVNPLDYLTVRMPLFSAKLVGKVSWIFKNFFEPNFFYISAIAMLCFIIPLVTIPSYIESMKTMTAQETFIATFLAMSGILLHELGHASACRKFGARHGGIGLGFYLISPVLYADVTDVWKLRQRERIIVNLAGLYMQLLLCTLAGIIFMFTYNGMALLFIYINLLSFITNLNPFFRYDGYWVLSDAVKIHNLRRKAFRAVKEFIVQLSRNFKWTPKTRTDYFLLIYGSLSMFFLFVFLGFVIYNDPNSILQFPYNLYLFFKKLLFFNDDIDFSWMLSEAKKLVVPFFFYYIIFNMLRRKVLSIKK
jgi:putative peptide zinc metalloprotease protein